MSEPFRMVSERSAASRRLIRGAGYSVLAAAAMATFLALSGVAKAAKPKPGVCGLNSIAECVGALEGTACGGGGYGGYCLGAPTCYCFTGRGNGRGRGSAMSSTRDNPR